MIIAHGEVHVTQQQHKTGSQLKDCAEQIFVLTRIKDRIIKSWAGPCKFPQRCTTCANNKRSSGWNMCQGGLFLRSRWRIDKLAGCVATASPRPTLLPSNLYQIVSPEEL